MIGAAPRSERHTAWTVRASFTCAGTAQAITGRRYPRKAGPSGPPASTRSRRRLTTKDPRTRSADLTWAKQIHLHPGHPSPTERRRARSKRTNRTTASPGPPLPAPAPAWTPLRKASLWYSSPAREWRNCRSCVVTDHGRVSPRTGCMCPSHNHASAAVLITAVLSQGSHGRCHSGSAAGGHVGPVSPGSASDRRRHAMGGTAANLRHRAPGRLAPRLKRPSLTHSPTSRICLSAVSASPVTACAAPRPTPAASPCCGLLPATVELPIQWPVRCSSIAERRRAAHRDNRD